MAQVVSRCRLTADAWVQSQAVPLGIAVDKGALR